jgi:clan AA aspartic protease (TIGR02281 family)
MTSTLSRFAKTKTSVPSSRQVTVFDPKGQWMIDAARGFHPPTITVPPPDVSDWEVAPKRNPVATQRARQVDQVIVPVEERRSRFWEWVQYRRELRLAKAKNAPQTIHTMHTEHTKGPRDWTGIAKTVNTSSAALAVIVSLAFLGYQLHYAIASPHGFGGGGNGMGPPPVNSYDSASGSICYRNTARHAASSHASVATPGTAVATKDRDGAYQIDGIVSGGLVHFIVDTGATYTVIPQETAEELGLHGEYTESAGTANGSTRAAPVRVGNFRIGGIVLHDVVIRVVPALPSGRSLLGTDVLNMLGEMHMQDGKMVIQSSRGA